MNQMRLLLSLLILLAHAITYAVTTIRLDPELISQNDTFKLILSSDEINQGGLPNLTPLQKEFTILGTEHNVSYNMVNGQTSAQTQWVIVLRPKKTGTLTIPSIRIGSEQTKPTSIEVREGDVPSSSSDDGQAISANSDAVMLKTEVSETNPYVNQQLLYTVKLYNNQRLIGAQYHHPTVQDALLIPLGEERHYQTQVNDETYMVEEQQYAIFPQKSGPLALTPPSFETAVFDGGYPKRLHLKGQETPVTIRPAPSNYQHKNWLPAKNVTLAETYDASTNGIKAGDTITRTVTLQALAMPAQLLPAIDFEETSQFKVYPESPEVKNIIKPNELMGTSTVKVTYLFSEAGDITIPKLEVPWFNISTGKTEIASLPSHVFKIQPGSATIPKSVAPSQQISSPKFTDNDESSSEQRGSLSNSYSLFFALGIGFLFGLLAVLLFIWLRKSNYFANGKARAVAIKRVLNACENNRPKEAHDALLIWAKIQWPEKNILNLQDVAIHCRDGYLKKELVKLSQFLYDARVSRTWQGKELGESFNKFYQSNTKKSSGQYKTRSDLPPMNP